jgi:uncharacterized damage-inducible protein DinB
MPYVTILVAVLMALPAAAAEGDFKPMFLKHWRVAKEFTLAVAEAMPAEHYDFKPNPEELSFGRLMTHIAAQNSSSCASATGTRSRDEPAANDKATAIRFLTEAFDTCARELDAMSPEQLRKVVYEFGGEPVLAQEALWYAFTHMAHHRGQAEVYLRVKNIKPPAWRF